MHQRCHRRHPCPRHFIRNPIRAPRQPMALKRCQQHGKRQIGAIPNGAEQGQQRSLLHRRRIRTWPKADAIRRQPLPIKQFPWVLLAIRRDIRMCHHIALVNRVARLQNDGLFPAAILRNQAELPDLWGGWPDRSPAWRKGTPPEPRCGLNLVRKCDAALNDPDQLKFRVPRASRPLAGGCGRAEPYRHSTFSG